MATKYYTALMRLVRKEGGTLAEPGEQADLSHLRPAQIKLLEDMGAIMTRADYERLPEEGKERVVTGQYNVAAGATPDDLKKEA